MDEFEARFRDGKSQHDPQLLSEAYTMVADAFVGVGDQEEAAKWREKAAVEAAKVKGTESKCFAPDSCESSYVGYRRRNRVGAK